MSEGAPVARSPIVQAEPGRQVSDWRVSAASSKAALRLNDVTALSKVLVRGRPEEVAGLLCEHRRTRRNDGTLILGSGPDSWLLLGAPGRAADISASATALLEGCGSLVSVIDVTHGNIVLRLSGEMSVRALEKLCAINLADSVTPDHSCFRSRLAGVVCTVARDDDDGGRSYLICSDRSSGQYFFDALLDAGREFGIDVTGYPETET